MLTSRPLHTDPRAPRFVLSMALALALPWWACGCSESESAPRTTPQATSETSAPGAIRFDEPVFDFGRTFQGDEIRHSFDFVNSGGKPIRVVRVKPTCGCTIPVFTQDPVAPGAHGTVDVVFKTGSILGRTEKPMRVYTDDERIEPIELVMRGEIDVELWIDPDHTDLGTLWAGSNPGPRTLTVSWLGSLDLEVSTIETTSESLVVTSREPFESGNRRGLRVTFELRDWEKTLEESHTDVYQQYVVLETNNPRHPRLTHPIVGTFSKPVIVTPRVVNFGVIRGTAEPKKIRITARPGLTPTFGGAQGPSFIRISPLATAPADSLDLSIELLPDAPAGSIKEDVKIRTGIPEQPEISVYVLANVHIE